jgi:hypothetical protein
MPYSKYRQYTYFVWGLHNHFTPIKKFLEQEFKTYHDQEDNIPISLELHNLPAMIASLATIHGIPLTQSSMQSQVQQVRNDNIDIPDICIDGNDPIQAVTSINQLQTTLNQSKLSSPTSSKSTVIQCWLCDGPHTFKDCKDLKRLHSGCAKHPTLSKYVAKMVQGKQDDNTKCISIKAILEAHDEEDHIDHLRQVD